jgi:hypothetical protein
MHSSYSDYAKNKTMYLSLKIENRLKGGGKLIVKLADGKFPSIEIQVNQETTFKNIKEHLSNILFKHHSVEVETNDIVIQNSVDVDDSTKIKDLQDTNEVIYVVNTNGYHNNRF